MRTKKYADVRVRIVYKKKKRKEERIKDKAFLKNEIKLFARAKKYVINKSVSVSRVVELYCRNVEFHVKTT